MVVSNHSILYYRFHGAPVLYKSEYKKQVIKKVNEDITAAKKIEEAYVYFNNTWGPGGINNARHMQGYLKM